MTPLSRNEIQARFRRAEGQLDDALRTVVGSMGETNCKVTEHSNRTGFDWAFGYFTWEYWFQCDEFFDGDVWRAEVVVSYAQPDDEGVAESVDVAWKAEVFSLGSSSHFLRRGCSRQALGDMDGPRLSTFVEEGLESARAALRERRPVVEGP